MILSYLRKNPEAGDTLEGISKWWLELERIEVSVEEVSNALDFLITKGLVKTLRPKGGKVFYKVYNKSSE